QSSTGQAALDWAMTQLGKPYVWGAQGHRPVERSLPVLAGAVDPPPDEPPSPPEELPPEEPLLDPEEPPPEEPELFEPDELLPGTRNCCCRRTRTRPGQTGRGPGWADWPGPRWTRPARCLRPTRPPRPQLRSALPPPQRLP